MFCIDKSANAGAKAMKFFFGIDSQQPCLEYYWLLIIYRVLKILRIDSSHTVLFKKNLFPHATSVRQKAVSF